MDIKKSLSKTLAQRNFWAFCVYYDSDFFYKRPFLWDVAQVFQKVIDEYKNGNAISVSISMPPRAGKSYITSLFAAYWLCRFPELSVMRNTCTATLYDKFSYDTRAIIRSTKLQDVFPEISLQQDKQNIGGWNLTTAKQVSYFGAGVGGSIIGFGANLAITDDLYKSMTDALSSTVQQTTKSWKQSAHDSRKEKNCPEIYIGTRWTKDDIIGEAIASGDLETSVVIPALTENDKSFCEDVKTTDEYIKIRDTIERSIWNAEYMQYPIELEGILLPKESIKFSKQADLKPIYSFAVGDPADTGGDKFSMPFIHVYEIDGRVVFYVMDVIHSTKGIEANTERVLDKMHKWGCEYLFYESNGVGLAAVLLIKNRLRAGQKIHAFNSSINKEVRIFSHFEFVQKFFVFDADFEAKPEYKIFISDVTNYRKDGDNKHRKDAIDVLCSAANIMKIKFKNLLY